MAQSILKIKFVAKTAGIGGVHGFKMVGKPLPLKTHYNEWVCMSKVMNPQTMAQRSLGIDSIDMVTKFNFVVISGQDSLSLAH